MELLLATRNAFNTAGHIAHRYGHGQIKPHHLVLALLRDQQVRNVLLKLHVDEKAIHDRLDTVLLRMKKDRPYNPAVFPPEKRVKEVTKIIDQTYATMGKDMKPWNILAYIALYDSKSLIGRVLREEGITAEAIRLASTPIRSGGPSLQKHCVNLNQAVINKEIGPAIGRDDDIAKILRTLSRKHRANALVVGDSGIGKTTTVKALAYQIMHNHAPAAFHNMQIFMLNNDSLRPIAMGGEGESHIYNILREISQDENAVLLIDNMHTLSSGLLGVLKTTLESGSIRCVATTNHKGLRYIESDPQLSQLFLKQDMNEPNMDDVFQVVTLSIEQYQDHHAVHYTHDAIWAAIKLSARHIKDRKMPAKVFDVLDQAGADKNYNPGLMRNITATDIERSLSDMTGLPLSALDQDSQKKMKTLEADLKASVMDQDEAARILANAIRRSRAGLNDPTKPIGSFLFQGPTGVGKTEITKQLGETLGMEVLRFDMSEYMEKHSISKLIGTPPGYVGFDQAGLLTDAAEKSPHSIILLDEIEKAHPDIYNILLQVMDHGKLTDHNGKQVDFRNTIIVMTTNAGSTDKISRNIGFNAAGSNDNNAIDDAIKRIFTPEFRNRLDAIVPFKHLEKPTVNKIATKFLKQLAERLLDRNIDIEWTDEARDWLVDKGYNRDFGARPMARIIQEKIANPLADEILDGKLKNGGTVKISFNRAAQGTENESPLIFTCAGKTTQARSLKTRVAKIG